MGDSTSEATSPYLPSLMAYTTFVDQFNHANPCNFRQHTSGEIVIQGEPSEASGQPRARGRRAKLDDAQKRENKRQSDIKYRLNKKIKENDLIAKNERLQEDNGRLTTENGDLKEEIERLTVKNRHLEESIRGLQSKGKLPAEDTQRQDSYTSQPTSQLDHQSIYVQDHREVDSNHEEVVYTDHCTMDSEIEGAIDGDDGLEINDLRSLLSLDNETNRDGRVAMYESAPEYPESSLSGMYHADEFLMKLDQEVLSKVDFSDFTGLEGEQTTVGRYTFPLSLIPTLERINDVWGDVSATSLINSNAAGTIYVLFCATIKEMDDIKLEQVTKKKMLKWRDTIKDALRINFSVKFAMDHLKKIARAYFGLIGCQILQSIDAKILKLEAEVNDLKKKHAETYEESKCCIAAAKEFRGMPVSTESNHH